MKKTSKVLIGFQIGILMTAVALPVQAAVDIGAPRPFSDSVFTTLRSYFPVTKQATSAPAPTTTYVQNSTPASSQYVKKLQPKSGRYLVSLKKILNKPTPIPVTVTNPTPAVPAVPSTPAPTPVPVPVPVPTPAPAPAPTNPTLPPIPSVTVLTDDEQHMVDMINQERIAAGLNPVKSDLRLASVGRAKANDLKENNYFAHTSPIYGSPWDMMQQVGLTVGWAGENISGNKSVEASMAALMLSPGHRANILDPRFTHVGVGIAYESTYGTLYVQEFLQE